MIDPPETRECVKLVDIESWNGFLDAEIVATGLVTGQAATVQKTTVCRTSLVAWDGKWCHLSQDSEGVASRQELGRGTFPLMGVQGAMSSRREENMATDRNTEHPLVFLFLLPISIVICVGGALCPLVILAKGVIRAENFVEYYTGFSLIRGFLMLTTVFLITSMVVVANHMYSLSEVAASHGQMDLSRSFMKFFIFYTFLATFYGLRTLK